MKKIKKQDQLATKRDIFDAIEHLCKDIIKRIDRMYLAIMNLLRKIRYDMKQFNRRNNLLEKELIKLELKIKSLEERLDTKEHLQEKLPN